MVKPTKTNARRRDIGRISLLVLAVLLLNFVGSFFFHRFDLTSEKRYTLAPSTKKLLSELNDEVYLKVYLSGNFDPAFTRLRNATREILDEFRIYSGKQVQYQFITPGEGLTQEEAANVERQLFNKGLIPEELNIRGREKSTQTVIWPGALVSYKGKEAVWQIFTRQTPGVSIEESVNNSVEELEYSLTNTIRKLQREKKSEITFIQGHGELDTLSAYDYMRVLSEYYDVNRTTIPKGRELSALKGTDAIVIAGPDSAFSDREAYVIDQFIMNGGKALWLIDPLSIDMDSLRQKGYTIALNRPLNVEEMLFKYGVRVNPVMVQDIQCGYLNINDGFQKGQPHFQLYPWLYKPLINAAGNEHPIVRNLDLVKFEFAATLDTISSAKGIQKTVLLRTSRNTRTQPSPVRIFLRSVRSKIREDQFQEAYLPVACLLEGEFSSFVANRLPSVFMTDTALKYKAKGVKTKMIVIADADVARNEFVQNTGQVFPLGFDRNTQQMFANGKFLLNCMNYLLDDEGMLQLRAREVKLRLLDRKKAKANRSKWQMLNVALPLGIIILLATAQFYTRKRKYAGKTWDQA